MEKICQHIEKLLAQHDYVVVPNLGGFVVQSQSAVLLSDRITPPLSTIGFNPLLFHGDGLLAIELSRTDGMSYRTSMELIDLEVEKIKSQLNTVGNFQFGNLGVLQQNQEGNLIFTPIEKADFLPCNFGLSDLHVSARNVELYNERRKITFTLPSPRFYKYAAASILILGLLFVSPQVNDMRQSHYADLSSIAFTHTSKIAIKPIAVTKPAAPTITKDIEVKDLNNFHVIVASMSNQKAADILCNELLEDKFKNAHILPPTKTFQVAIQSFSDRDKAIQFMENLRHTEKRFKTAWVLCK